MSPILKNSVHEMSPFESVHEKSPTLKNSVHEVSLSTKCLHPLANDKKNPKNKCFHEILQDALHGMYIQLLIWP